MASETLTTDGERGLVAHSSLPPAPYIARELSGEDHRGMGWIEDANGRDITSYGDMPLSMEENRAIGRLIAAAPDLLEALQVARAELENHHAPGMLGVLHTVDQAIAKALGESCE